MKFSFLLVLCVSCFALFAQSPPVDSTSEGFADFPKAYLGKWSGELEIFNAKGKVQGVPMQLHLLPIDDTTFTYTIFYGEDLEAGKRDYLLRKGKRGENHWIVDEQDGILLDNFYLGGVLHGPFTVAGSALTSSLEIKNGQLSYRITSGPTEGFRTSGTTAIQDGKEENYEVTSFQIQNFQRAILNRM